MTRSLAITFNALGLYAIALVLLVAFAAAVLLFDSQFKNGIVPEPRAWSRARRCGSCWRSPR